MLLVLLTLLSGCCFDQLYRVLTDWLVNHGGVLLLMITPQHVILTSDQAIPLYIHLQRIVVSRNALLEVS
jgi:hypothetical protein